ncbi:hypothetical protein [Variovorax sp. YR216]|uniref:hypothetical protein n=1 Tax=Variovorax sp. YR216 TaxID=1882828 RepID=UPI0008986EB0|nr:hypothetical protein [Variovorax sp. YR216]SEB19136.1 hypothetical protein SAMN05444680_112126 [Variovorax sp. YR216]
MQILSRLFRETRDRTERRNDGLDRLVARVLRINPCLRRAYRHEEHLQTALAWSASFLGKLVTELPLPRLLNSQSWARDPYLQAFFATADQVSATLANSHELNRFFQQSHPLKEAFAVLGMDMTESRNLDVIENGSVVRRHVAAIGSCPETRQLSACQSNGSELLKEIVNRLIDQLALDALEMIVMEPERCDMLECERALFGRRHLILERLGIGIPSMAGGGPHDGAEEAQLGALLDESDHDLRGLGLLPEAFEDQLQRTCGVLLRPDLHIQGATKLVRLGEADGLSPAATAAGPRTTPLGVVRIPGSPSREFAITLVRVAMIDMPQPTNAWDQPIRIYG